MTAEQWRPIVGFEGLYEVSDHGRVRSVQRVIVRANGIPMTVNKRIRRTKLAGRKRDQVSTTLSREGVVTSHRVAVEVARAFHGPCPAGLEIRHLDGNSQNNRADNLKYGTHSENMLDAVRHGTHPLLRANRERRARERAERDAQTT